MCILWISSPDYIISKLCSRHWASAYPFLPQMVTQSGYTVLSDIWYSQCLSFEVNVFKKKVWHTDSMIIHIYMYQAKIINVKSLHKIIIKVIDIKCTET